MSRDHDLIAHLERNPDAVPAYARALEQTISDLMDATFHSQDADERSRLATLEMRGRLVLERWRVRCGKN